MAQLVFIIGYPNGYVSLGNRASITDRLLLFLLLTT